MLDHDRCYRAVHSRDPRFDGWFYTAVVTTGIYCRPSCPALTPKRANVRFFTSPAAAHGSGFRACKRCRPDAVPGSPEWNSRSDVVARAMRLIADGALDQGSVPAMAARLGYSERQLHRLLLAEVGAGALALARAHRAQTARILLETTSLPVTEVAFAAGFTSVRQFNDTIRAIYSVAPSMLRKAAATVAPPPGTVAGGGPGAVTLRLPYRQPFAAAELFGFLAARAVPGIEAGDARSYRRTLSLRHGTATMRLEAGPEKAAREENRQPPAAAPAAADDTARESGTGHVRCVLRLDDLRDLGTAVARARRLLDLDADPQAVDELLGADPVLARLVTTAPGRRSPGHVDPNEAAFRAVVGQQVSVAGARAVTARLVQALGEPLGTPRDGLTHLFPSPARLAEIDPDASGLPMPRARVRTVVALARALGSGELTLDAGSDPEECAVALMALPGIGPWTAGYVRMRALGDPDVFLATDLGVRRAVERLAHGTTGRGVTGVLTSDGRAWRPWRSYATHHLWASLSPPRLREDAT